MDQGLQPLEANGLDVRAEVLAPYGGKPPAEKLI